eukprot:TRINITY_DN2087_c1_g1_i1.p1 TRINITY_DN2087_c1_g1~~TRINITY_DN2087_c1_g1_i1.p1  ORF type:complete len:1362 (+),score=175.35 TRINITY_DN2087_c1_g1_i1:125-4087(+)
MGPAAWWLIVLQAVVLASPLSCEAPCSECPMPNTRSLEVFVSNDFRRGLVDTTCDVVRGYAKRHDLNITGQDNMKAFSDQTWASDLTEDYYTYSLEMFAQHEEEILDLLYFPSEWIPAFEGYIENLTSLNISNIRTKLIKHATTNMSDIVSVATSPDQTVFYYKKSVFDMLNITWPTDSLDSLADIMRVIKKDFGGFPLAIPAAHSNESSYSFATLLSTQPHAGHLVEDDGRVTINNTNVTFIMNMWRSWYGDILPERSVTRNEAREMFLNGSIAVYLGWSSDSAILNVHSKSDDFAAGPVPGGLGCSGDVGFAINSQSTANVQTHLRNILQDFVTHGAKFLHISSPGSQPVVKDFRSDTKTWEVYKSYNRILHESHEAYPEFWEAVTYRSAGCRAVFRTCADTVHSKLEPFLSRRNASKTSDKVVSELETDLHKLLGHWKYVPGDNSSGTWTKSRVALLTTCAVCLVLFILLGLFIWSETRKMRRVPTYTIPISVLLGLVVMAFGVVLSTSLVTLQDGTTKAISRELAKDVRVQSMTAMENLVTVTVDSLRQSGQASLYIIQRTVSSAKNFLGKMELHPRSFVIVIDRKNGDVLISSNPSIVPETSVLDWEASPYTLVSAALKQYQWRTGESIIDAEVAHTIYGPGGDAWHVNAQQLDAGTEGLKFVGFSWVMLYMTPRDIILSRADEVRDKSLDIAILQTVLAIAVAVLSAALISRPLVNLAVDMEHVRVMDVESLKKRDSALTEVKALLAGFYSVCKILKEYKSFLPDALFNEDTADDISPQSNSRPPFNNGKAAIVFTDIQSSTEMWYKAPHGMKKSLRVHNQAIRRCIDRHDGYEVKTIGDSFMVAFEDLHKAVAFCIAVQEVLYASEWPTELLAMPLCKHQTGKWKGLRVRMGVNYGSVTLENSQMTGRADYLGATVNKAAKLESAGFGGSISLTEDDLKNLNLEALNNPVTISCGTVELRNMPDQEVHLLIPKSLKGRVPYLEEKVAVQNNAVNPLVRNEAVSISSMNETATLTKSLMPRMLKEKMHRAQGTVAHVRVAYESLNTSTIPLVRVNEVLSATVHCVEMCGGTVVSVCSAAVVSAWNTTKKCTTHVLNTVRFIGVFSKQLNHTDGAWRDKCTLGVASGGVLYGNAGSRELRFSLVIGSVVETAGLLSEASKDLGAFCLMATLPGQADLTLDNTIRKVIRPVDTWSTSCGQKVVIYQPRVGKLSRIGEQSAYIPPTRTCNSEEGIDGECDAWGWTKEYTTSFHNGDVERIGESADPVLKKVAAWMSKTVPKPHCKTAVGYDLSPQPTPVQEENHRYPLGNIIVPAGL